MKLRSILLLCVLSHLVHPTASGAQWATDGNALCTATAGQTNGGAISDGAGGAIVVWSDSRSGNPDIYAQRVNALGIPQWTADGVPVRTGGSAQSNPTIASDGAGGAIIFFTHLPNNGATDIYAQRINSAGVIQWTTDGVLICSAMRDQYSPRAVADGAGGAVVAWLDNRDGDFSTADVFARRINAAGIAQWASDGVAVCTAANWQRLPALVSDGTGGAIITWSDFRNGANYGVYARRVDSAGVAQWTVDGVALDTDTGFEEQPAITIDGAGGAIVTWRSNVAGPGITDIYAQRLNSSGSAQWNVGGVLACAAIDHQSQPQIVSDGTGGAIVTWQDLRGGVFLEDDIYAQRLDASGGAQWTPNGVALCTAAGAGILPQLASDGAHGAVVSWIDTRTGASAYNVYARRINGAGTPLWTPDGVALCTATNSQVSLRVVPDGVGGAIVAWDDFRTGNADIYANRVTPGGTVPTAVGETPAIPAIAVTNYPNPFSTTTAIEVTLDRDAHVNVDIFDVAGRRVRAMNVGRVVVGIRSINFDGRDEDGTLLPSGLYFYRIQAGDATVTRKMVIQR